MRRLALPLLGLLLLFLATPFADPCDAGTEDCPPACHFSCLDGCASAPLGVQVTLLPAAADPARSVAAGDEQPVDFSIPPDFSPPRA